MIFEQSKYRMWPYVSTNPMEFEKKLIHYAFFKT